MRTTARNISQITNFISPSIIELSSRAAENGNIFMFPEPSLILKKEPDSLCQEERVYNLVSQIFNYDIQSRNLYFVKLEIRMLLQELKAASESVLGSSREIISNIYKETAEIVLNDGLINKTDYWNSCIENIKNKAEAIISNHKQINNQINNYSFKPYANRPVFNLSNIKKYENKLNNSNKISNISVTGNSLFKPVNYIITSAQREPWQKDAYEFYNIYKSMGENEQKEFLKAVSMTEYDITSVKRMTKEQWSVFLQNVLPQVSLYVKNAENSISLQNYTKQNPNLRYVLDMTQNQWLNFKTALLNSTDNNINTIKQFFKTTVGENNSFDKWESEKQEFINFIYNNNYAPIVNEAVKSTEINKYNLDNINVSELEINEISSKFTDWITYLTESQWEEVKTVLTTSEETEYIRPLLETVKNKKHETEPEFSAEKREVIEYIKNNKTQSLNILHKLTENKEIKKELTGWVNLKVLEKKTTTVNKTVNNNINEKTEINRSTEEITQNRELINNTSAQLTDWITYLTESQWEEVKTVLTASEETEYIRPLLETVKNKKQETEPEFSAEKREVIEYIKNNKTQSLNILHKLSENEEIKKELTGWVNLKVLEKKTTTVNKTVNNNINEKTEINKESEEIAQNHELVNISTQLTDWITYLTETQWESVKTILTTSEETEYIRPLLETVKNKKQETEPEFSAEKREVIEYIKNNKIQSLNILNKLAENEEIKKELTGWVDLKASENRKTNINKSNGNTQNNLLNNNKLKNTSLYLNEYTTDVSEKLGNWMKYITKPQLDEIRTFINTQNEAEYLKPVLENVNSQPDKNNEQSFEEQKDEFIRKIINNKDYAGSFIKLASHNERINAIISDLAEKADTNSLNKVEEAYKTGDVKKILSNVQITKANNATIKRIINWVYNTENRNAVQNRFQNIVNNAVRNTVRNTVGSVVGNKVMKKSTAEENAFADAIFENLYQNPQETVFQIMNKTHFPNNINPVYTDESLNSSIAENVNYFTSYLINRNNKSVAENELNQYKTADLVIAKNSKAQNTVNSPVKIPDISTQVQQTVKTQVNDIIKLNKSTEFQQKEKQTIYELTKRINSQQKEIENILTTQKQMLKITDISVVAEKVMNQMQSQLRLEKMRRGL